MSYAQHVGATCDHPGMGKIATTEEKARWLRNRLRKEREDRDLSQAEVAARIGVAASTFGMWEQHRRDRILISQLHDWATAVGLRLHMLLTRSDDLVSAEVPRNVLPLISVAGELGADQIEQLIRLAKVLPELDERDLGILELDLQRFEDH